MITLEKEPRNGLKVFLLSVLVVSLIANIAACFTISQYTTLPEPIVKTVLVHDTVTVTKTAYSVEYDTIRVRTCKGKEVVAIDEYIDHNQKLPTPYRSSDVFVGFKTSNHFWGRKFAPITEYSLGCNGKIKRDIPTHPGWLWCTGEWIMSFKEPIPLWETHNE